MNKVKITKCVKKLGGRELGKDNEQFLVVKFRNLKGRQIKELKTKIDQACQDFVNPPDNSSENST